MSAAVTRAGVDIGTQFVVVGAVLLVAGQLATRGLLPPTADQARSETRSRWSSGWTRPVLIFGAMGFVVMIGEATAVSRLTTFTYAGILIGPAIVGWFAAGVGLIWTFTGLLPLLLGVAANARLMAARSTTAQVSVATLTSGDR